MSKQIKTTSILLFLLLIGNPLFSISPTGNVLSIGQSSEIGRNIFPISSYISYDVYDFKFIENYPTNMTFDIKGGYGNRSISQDPITGLAKWSTEYDNKANTEFFDEDQDFSRYGSVYTGWQMKFTQPLPISEKIEGDLTSWISVAGHYEQAIDKFIDYRSPISGKTSFMEHLETKYSSEHFFGIPELNGNRYLHDFSLNLGSFYKSSIKDIPYTVSLTGNLAPRWLLNNFSAYDAKSNYFQITPSFSISKSLYRENYKDLFNGSSFRLFEFTISNSLSYRYLNGTAVPQYKISYGNVRHDINNTFALNFYGPQVLAADCYPYLKLYYNADFSWGKLNNLDPQFNEKKAGELTHLVGAVLDLRIIGIIHVGYRANFQFSVNSGYSFGHSPYFYVQL